MSEKLLGRIDDSGQVLIPLQLIASDGLEVEIEAALNLMFQGSLVIPTPLMKTLGWSCLGGRRVRIGSSISHMEHFLGSVILKGELIKVVSLSGALDLPMVGQKMFRGQSLRIDFQHGQVFLE